MRQLLCLLILHTENQKAISNAEIKEILWNDKTDESYFNNRGVQLRALRSALAKVDENISITSNSGNWSIDLEPVLCDYVSSFRILTSLKNESFDGEVIELVMTLTGKGSLLSEMRYEWLDRYKADYTELVISSLYKAIESPAIADDPEKRILLADNLLLFDSLDEEAVRAKCAALLRLKRSGTAKAVFEKFTTDYQNALGEPFGVNFNDFVSR